MKQAGELAARPRPEASNSAPSAGAESTAAAWIDELLAKLHAIYGQKWTTHVAGIPYEALRQTWAESLDGYTKAQVREALNVVTRDMRWPPAVPDFVAALSHGRTPEQRAFQRRLAEADAQQAALPSETWAETKARGAAHLQALRAQLGGQ